MSNPCVTRDSSSLIFSETLEAVCASNPCITRDSTSLLIFESLGAVWAIQSVRHP